MQGEAMSIRIFRSSTEMDSGAMAEGYDLYIELFGLCLSFTVGMRK
jgi:hypothetical protein